ncbi:Solute carrier family 23 member 1 [Holothuria leucospilota]|uniref:Solute carrier family 23 member 1 n=1 Tax=Holothuria leucospilota TaxID=206669 RepID=A0A9Q1CL41_HOLLE|nr:Solute carrier family 23 member 1 [Holothuria leucospilota]
MESTPEWPNSKLSKQKNGSTTEIEIQHEGGKDNNLATKSDLVYRIEERPPWIMTILMAVQHFSANFSRCLVQPFLIAEILCFDREAAFLTRHIATTFVVTGVTTLLQIIFGSRLPIIQGPGGGYIVPAVAMLSVRGECPAAITANSTMEEKQILREEAYSRMNEINGAVFIASIVQCLIGFTGLVGVLLRFIGPITIAVTLTMIGIDTIPLAMNLAGSHWCISIPCCPNGKYLALILFALIIMWVVCAILTACGVFPEDSNVYGYAGRTDLKADNLRDSPWISFPYPGQWGLITFNVAGIVGALTAIVVSILDSIGDYHACAQISREPPPPDHAVNRGIGVEGIGGLLAALWGIGFGVSSYSGDIALLGLTKVASRSVLISSGVIFILVGFFIKLSALINGISKPILGACSLTFGSATLDQLLGVLFKNGMLVGAVLSTVLDNVIAGTPEEKGTHWREAFMEHGNASPENEEKAGTRSCKVYDLPFGMNAVAKRTWTRFIPFCPTFKNFVKLDAHDKYKFEPITSD